MNVASQALSALRRIGIVVLIVIAFLFGLATTVYLSLRSPEVMVPEVVGKDRFAAEKILGDAGLNFRVRATRPSSQVQADTVLFQLPRAGEVVKGGQTVAMDISRIAKEGEVSEAVVSDNKTSAEKVSENRKTIESGPAENDNADKPERKRNTKRNANDNSNANSNRARTSADSGNISANRAGNSGIANLSSNANQDERRRATAPKPSPIDQKTPKENL